MSFDASNFIGGRSNRFSVTNTRINAILWYDLECYQLLLNDKVQYSKSGVKSNTTYPFEDQLKFKLIEDYLSLNTTLLRSKSSHLEEISFEGETQKRFVDATDGKEKPDKIDIYIHRLGLQSEWGGKSEIYYSIECKRINILSDTREYVKDIEKFTIRDHTNTRLPFEGQLGFIENSSLSHGSVSNEINRRLKTSTTIKTDQDLQPTIVHTTHSCTYRSKHRKNFGKNEGFIIDHLFLDYSGVVVS